MLSIPGRQHPAHIPGGASQQAPAAASAADSAVTVLGQRDLQHHRTQQGQRQHLPQEGSGEVSTASLKDMSGTMSLHCCGQWAGAHVLTGLLASTPSQHHSPSSACNKGKRLAQGRQQDRSCGGQLWQRAGTGCGCLVCTGVPSSLAQVGRGLSLVYLLLPPSRASTF